MQMAQLRTNKQEAKIDQALDGLKKVKGQAQDIGKEARRHVDMTGGMVEDTDAVNERMKKTESRLDRFVTSSSDSKVFWYIVA